MISLTFRLLFRQCSLRMTVLVGKVCSLGFEANWFDYWSSIIDQLTKLGKEICREQKRNPDHQIPQHHCRQHLPGPGGVTGRRYGHK